MLLQDQVRPHAPSQCYEPLGGGRMCGARSLRYFHRIRSAQLCLGVKWAARWGKRRPVSGRRTQPPGASTCPDALHDGRCAARSGRASAWRSWRTAPRACCWRARRACPATTSWTTPSARPHPVPQTGPAVPAPDINGRFTCLQLCNDTAASCKSNKGPFPGTVHLLRHCMAAPCHVAAGDAASRRQLTSVWSVRVRVILGPHGA